MQVKNVSVPCRAIYRDFIEKDVEKRDCEVSCKKFTLVRGSAVPDAADSLSGRWVEIKRWPFVEIKRWPLVEMKRA